MVNKIFQIGFNRCGTSSLFKLFDKYTDPKISAIHWDSNQLANTILRNIQQKRDALVGYEKYTFFCDMESNYSTGNVPLYIPIFISYYKLLDKQYKGSKFILNIRNIDNWIKSRINYLNKRYAQHQKKYYHVESDEKLIEIWKNQWYDHYESVVKYFTGTDKLLIYNVESDPLSKIIDFFPWITFTTDSLPHINRSKT